MTETELRQKVVDTASAWLGTKEGSSRHAEMLNIYNDQTPLPRGYAMKIHDAWCAAFVSAVSLQCGLKSIMPTECGCPPMIQLYQNLGRWMEDDAYTPQAGDVIFYDWQDSGIGDNVGQADHVGIVIACTDGIMTVIEGNCSNAVQLRQLEVNGKNIRGFGLPDYAALSDVPEEPELDEPTEEADDEQTADHAADPYITAIARDVIAGKWGNGQARKDALAVWFVDAVQNEVNRLMGG